MFRKISTCLLLLVCLGLFAGPTTAESNQTDLPQTLEARIRAAEAGLDVSSAWLTTLSKGTVGAFGDGGLRLAGHDDGEPWQLALHLRSFGRSGAMVEASDGTLRASGVRAELDHGHLRQWVTGSGSRLTHGFTLQQPPYAQLGRGAEAGSGDLLLLLDLDGDLEASFKHSGSAVELRRGSRSLSYGEFTAVDAGGQVLPTRIEPTETGLRLRVDDTGAAYPLMLTSFVTEVKKLFQPLATTVEHAGWSVSLDGDTAVVGAFLADVGFAGAAGKVYVFERNEGGAENWGLLQTLTASDAEPGASFGYNVSVSGDYIAIGAHQKDDDLILPNDRLVGDSGRVYIFKRSGGTWSQIRELENPTPGIFDNFGFSVAIDGDTVAVGTWLAEPLPSLTLENGEVSIFQRDVGGPDQWGIVTTITTPTPMGWANFGHDVALDGDTLVVGSPFTDLIFTGTGRAWVFERNQGGANAWGGVTLLEADDGALHDRYGDAVAIDGDVIVVGADFADGTGLESGKAYVYERNEGGTNAWGQTARLTASDQEPGDFFGWAVAVEGDQVVVGSHFDDSPLFNAGSAYLYRRQPGGWTQVEKFLPAGVAVADDFGIALDISGGTILAGARLTGALIDSGAAYIFETADSTDLTISVVSTPNPVAPGGTVTYTVAVENLGSSDAADVVVSHLFAPDSGTGSTTSGCAEDPNGATSCTLGTVPAGSTVQYTLTRPVPGGASGTVSFTATAAASTGDPDPANNEVTDVIVVGGGGGGSADLLILKQDSDDPVAPGATLTYTLQVLNNGPDEAENVVITEALPAGVSGAVTSGCNEDPAGIPTCNIGNILPGTSKNVTVTVTVNAAAGATLLNTATVSADTDDPNVANNQANEATDVGAGSADLLIFIDDDVDPITAGDTLTYTVDVLNNGPDAAPGVVVTTTLPPSVTSPMTAGCAEDPNGSASCSLGEIPAGSSAQFTITVQTDPGTLDPLVATTSVTSDANDSLPDNNSSTEATTVEVVGDVDLFLFITDSADPVDAGMPLTYTFYVGNRGPGTAEGTVLTLPVSNDFLNTSTTGCSEDPGGAPVCTLGTVEPGSTKVVSFTGELPSTLSGTVELAASVDSANPELAPADNGGLETTTVIGTPGMADLVLSIEEAADPVAAGDSVIYRVTVLNLGPNLAESVVISAAPTPEFTGVTSTGCQGDPAGWPSCSLGNLEPGLPVTVTFEASVDLTASGVIQQQVSVQSTTDDPDTNNNSDVESTTIESVGLADLKITFSEAAATAAPMGTALYAVTVENLGPDPAENVSVETAITGAVGTATTVGCGEDPSGVPTCTLGTIHALSALASTSFTIEVPLPADATGTVEVTMTASSTVDDTDMTNNTATATTDIETTPPTVTLVGSLGDTGDGSLDECEQTTVAIDQLLVTFSEAMNDPSGDIEASDVTNPAVYQLISAGADHDLETEQCDALQGDDEAITIDAVTYDDASLTSTLQLSGPLADSPYRLLVCEAVSDAAGNGLDGDEDGSSGIDFARYFRIDMENLFTEGHFDCDLDEWEEVATADTEITYTAFDVDSARISGAAILYNNLSTTDFSIGQCVPASGTGSFQMSGMVWLRDLEADVTVSKTCELFDQKNCLGAALGMDTSDELFTAPTAGWTALAPASLKAPAGTMSALCSVDLLLSDPDAEMTVLIDDLRLSDKIFKNGFETGDTSHWSSTLIE